MIAPTAALSAFPYTPEESMSALHFYYYKMGDKLWRDYGFVDAFNLTANWYDNQCIAIDQGPIICMIEIIEQECFGIYSWLFRKFSRE